MIPRWSQALYCASLISVASALQLNSQDPPPEHSKSIRIYLTVTGKNVTSLISNPTALIVSIDNNPVPVTSLQSAKDDKILFAVVVDTSSSNAPNSPSIKAAALKIFQRLSEGGNHGYLVRFDARVTSTRGPIQPSEARGILDRQEFRGSTALYDAVGETCTQILSREKNPENPRRLIVLISDGHENQSTISASKAIELANEEGIAVFSLASNGWRSQDQFLKSVSSKTGGIEVAPQTIGDGVDSIFSAIDSQLLLSLDAPSSPDQSPHAMSVRTTKKGVSISAPAQISIR